VSFDNGLGMLKEFLKRKIEYLCQNCVGKFEIISIKHEAFLVVNCTKTRYFGFVLLLAFYLN
jgi:hypothetical protein